MTLVVNSHFGDFINFYLLVVESDQIIMATTMPNVDFDIRVEN